MYKMLKISFFFWIAIYTSCLNLFHCHETSNDPTIMTSSVTEEETFVEQITDQTNFCTKFNGKCQLCVENVQCFYCTESRLCVHGTTVLLPNSNFTQSKHNQHQGCTKPTGTCDDISSVALGMAGMSLSISIYVTLYVLCWVRRPKNYFVTMTTQDVTGPPAYTP